MMAKIISVPLISHPTRGQTKVPLRCAFEQFILIDKNNTKLFNLIETTQSILNIHEGYAIFFCRQ